MPDPLRVFFRDCTYTMRVIDVSTDRYGPDTYRALGLALAGFDCYPTSSLPTPKPIAKIPQIENKNPKRKKI